MKYILNNCLKQFSTTWMGSEIADMPHDNFHGYSRTVTKSKLGSQG